MTDPVQARETSDTATWFEAFYREHYGLVLSTATRRLGSRADAEDLAAEAFRLALEQSLAGRRITAPWLYTTVRNLVGNTYRGRERRYALERVLRNESQEAPDALHDLELETTVKSVLEGLSPTHAEVLIMTYWDELTTAEAAALLGCTAAAYRVRLHRARRAFSDAWKAQVDCTDEAHG